MSYLVLPWSFMYFILLCTGIINLSMNILAPSLPKLLKHGFMIFLGGYVLESSYVEQICVKIMVASHELPRKKAWDSREKFILFKSVFYGYE